MSEPSLALQGAIVSALKAVAGLNGRIYDRPPDNVTFPYVTVGDDQVIGDHADCLLESVEVFARVHAWSRAVGKPEVKKIVGDVVRTLNGADLSLAPDYALVNLEHDSTQYLDDPTDPLMSHAVVTFHALIDEA